MFAIRLVGNTITLPFRLLQKAVLAALRLVLLLLVLWTVMVQDNLDASAMRLSESASRQFSALRDDGAKFVKEIWPYSIPKTNSE
jgi:hypothetical protein